MIHSYSLRSKILPYLSAKRNYVRTQSDNQREELRYDTLRHTAECLMSSYNDNKSTTKKCRPRIPKQVSTIPDNNKNDYNSSFTPQSTPVITKTPRSVANKYIKCDEHVDIDSSWVCVTIKK